MKEFLVMGGFLMILAMMMFFPFVLILGINFLLEAAGVALLPYTFGTWFGSWCILTAFKTGLATRRKQK